MSDEIVQLRLDLNSARESYGELEEEYSKRATEITGLQDENKRLKDGLAEYRERLLRATQIEVEI